MSTQTGTITLAHGKIYIIDENGVTREASVGDKIFLNDLIKTLDGAKIDIKLLNGKVVSFDGMKEVLIDESVVGDRVFADKEVDGSGIDEMFLNNDDTVNDNQNQNFDTNDIETAAGTNNIKLDVPKYISSEDISDRFDARDSTIESLSNDTQADTLSETPVVTSLGEIQENELATIYTKQLEEKFDNKPQINIDEIATEDTTVNITITMPKNAVVGDTLTITNPDATTSDVVVTQEMIDNGYTLTYDKPGEGEVLTVSASITDQTGTEIGSTTVTTDPVVSDTPVDDTSAPTVVIADDNTAGANQVSVTITLPASAVVGDTLNVTNPDSSITSVEVTQDMIDNGYIASYDKPADGETLSVSASITDSNGNESKSGSDTTHSDTTTDNTNSSDNTNDNTNSTDTTNSSDTTTTSHNIATPTVSITEDSNSDGVINKSEQSGAVNISIEIVDNVVAGDTIHLKNGTETSTIEVTQTMVNNKVCNTTVPMPAEGESVAVSAYFSDTDGNSSEAGTAQAVVDTIVGERSDSAPLEAPMITISEDQNGDSTVNSSELQGDVNFSVSLSLDVQAGSILNLVVGGVPSTVTVTQAMIDAKAYSTTSAAPSEGDTLDIRASITDLDGNKTEESSNSVVIDTTYGDSGDTQASINMTPADDNSISTISGTIGESGASIDSLVVTDKNGNNVTLDNVTIDSDGVFSVDADLSTLVDGKISVLLNATDNEGNTTQLSDVSRIGQPSTPVVEILDDNNHDSVINQSEFDGNLNVRISFDEDISAGYTLNIDNNGTQESVEITQDMVNHGYYAFESQSVVDGDDYSVSATITDTNSKESESESYSVNIDTTYGDDTSSDSNSDITPASTFLSDEGDDGVINKSELKTSDIKGTIGEGAATLDSLVVSDEAGHKVTIDVSNVALESDGSYKVENIDLSMLDDGELTLTAKSTDNDGNRATTTSTIALDTIYGDDSNGDGTVDSASVSMSDANADNIVNSDEAFSTTISGNIGEGAATLDSIVVSDGAGHEVEVDLSDVTLDDSGAYTINDVDISSLDDGNLTIAASSTDNDGNTALTADTISKDTIAGNRADGVEVGAPAVTITEDQNNDGVVNAQEQVGKVDVSVVIDNGIVSGDTLHLDINGDTSDVTITQNMVDAGTYNFKVTSPDEGDDLVVRASITDKEGNTTAVGSDSVNIDTTYGDDGSDAGSGITPASATLVDESGDDVINASEVKTTDISGTIGEGAKTLDTLIVEDESGHKVIIDVKDVDVDADSGAYSVENVNLSTLSDGQLTVTAQSTDYDGNRATTTSSITLDTLYGDADTQASVDISKPTDGDSSVIESLNGTTGIDGVRLDSLVIVDHDGTKQSIDLGDVTQNDDGTYSISNIDVSSLADGKLRVIATSTDDDGNVIATEDTENKNLPSNPIIEILDDDNSDGTLNENEADDTVNAKITFEDDIKVDDVLTITNPDGSEDDIKITQDMKDNGYSLSYDTPDEGESLAISATITDKDNSDLVSDAGSAAINVDTTYGDDVDGDGSVEEASVRLTDNNGDDVINLEGATSNILSGTVGEGGATLQSLVVEDKDGNDITLDVSKIGVNPDGTYSVENVDFSSLADGTLSVSAVSLDRDGNTITKVDTIEKDVVYGDDSDDNNTDITPASVEITDNSENQIVTDTELTNSTISGNIGEGGVTLDSLIISDENGHSVTVDDVTLNKDGTYSAKNIDLSALNDGTLTVSALSTDLDGNKATAVDTITKDATYGDDGDDEGTDITDAAVTMADDSGDGVANASEQTLTISGTIGEGAATLDSLVVEDASGTKIDIDLRDITLNDDGTYTTNVDISSLSDGKLTLSALSTDNDGNQALRSSTLLKDTVYSDGESIASVDIVDEDANELVIDKELTTSTINGDVGEGTESIHSLIVADSDGNKVTIDTQNVDIKDNGAFSVANVDLSTLNDGTLTVIANYTDNVGNKITKTDTIEKDSTYGEDSDDKGSDVTPATVAIANDDGYDIINENGLQDSDISGTIGEGGANLESLIVADENGNEVNVSDYVDLKDIVKDDGSYSYNNIDLSSLNDGILTLTAVSTDIDGNSATKVDTINKDTVYGDDEGDDDYLITPASLDISDASGNEIVDSVEVLTTPINGSIGEGADTLDSLVISDEAGHKVTVDVSKVSVDSDGNYSLDVDLTSLDDGNLTVTAKSTDLDGNKAVLTDTIVKDVVYGDDLDDDGSITQATVAIKDVNNDSNYEDGVVNENELSSNKITGHIGEGGDTLDSLVISDEAGNDVVIDIDNVSMKDDGSYSVSGVDIASLQDGILTITAHSTDRDGNQAVKTDTISKDTLYGNDTNSDGDVTPVEINISDESGNGILTGETLESADIKGTIGEGGTTLDSLVVSDENNHSKSLNVDEITVNSDGTYTITNVDLSSLDDGTLTITAASTDEDGNATTTNTTIQKDTLYGNDDNGDGKVDAPTLTLGDASGDGVVNASELTSVSINGILGEGGASLDTLAIIDSEGTQVSIDVADVTIKDGAYSVENVDVSSLKDGTLSVQAHLSDEDGNVTTQTNTIEKDIQYGDDIDGDGVADVAKVALSEESGDGVINMHELVSNKIAGFIGEGGSTLDALSISDSAGNVMDIKIDDVAFDEDTNKYSVSDLDLSKLTDGTLTISASSTDRDGNRITKTDTVEKDTVYGDDKDGDGEITPAGVDISKPADDSLDLSGTIGEKAESLDSVEIVDEDGNKITFDVSKIDVDNDGIYSVKGVDVSDLAEGKLTVTAISTDVDGNTATVEDVEYKGIPSPANIEITEDVNNDGTINENELADKLHAKFTFEKDIAVDDTLKITNPDGSEDKLDITQDMLDNGYIVEYDAPAEGDDLKVSSTIVHNDKESRESSDSINVDTIAGEKDDGSEIAAPTITIDNDANSDGTINVFENGAQANITISIEDGVVLGDTLNVTINDETTQVEVDQDILDDGFYKTSTTMPDENDTLTISASFTDQEGNTTETGTTKATVDTIVGDKADGTAIVAPTVTITEDTNNDGVINATEKDGDVNISISIEDGVVAGDTINLTINGEDSSIEVTQDMIDDGVFKTTATMPDEAQTIEVSAHYTDQEGNVSESSSDSAVVDTIYGDDGDDEGDDITDATTDIADASGNDLIIQSETGSNKITGTIGEGGVTLDKVVVADEDGNEVNVDVANVTLNDDNTYSIDNVDVSALNDGSLTLSATSTDVDGNVALRTDTITKDTTYGNDTDGDGDVAPAEIAILEDSDDKVINNAEVKTSDISGTLGEGGSSLDDLVIRDEAGNEVSIDVSTVTINDDNTYSVADVDLSSLQDGTLSIAATSTDEDGNHTTIENTIAKDTVINVAVDSIIETADSTPTLKGNVDSDVATLKVEIVDANGDVAQTFTLADNNITLDENGNWKLDWSNKTDDDKLSDGHYDINVTAEDKAGNTATVSEADGFKVDGTASVDITSISDDTNVDNDFITNDNSLTISGTVDDGASVKSLEVNIANVTYDLNSDELSIDDNGVWTLDLSGITLADKTYEAKVEYIDNSNNAASYTQSVTIDTKEALVLDKFTYDDDDSKCNDQNIKFTGTIENATSVQVSVTDADGNEKTYDATIHEDGTFEALTDAITTGDSHVKVVATDEAGNETVISKDFSVDLGVITLGIDDKNDNENDGTINTSDTTPTLTGAVINSTDIHVAVKDGDGNTVWEDDVDTSNIDKDNNTWSIDVADSLDEGTYTVETVAKHDGADDVKVVSGLVIDTTAPDSVTIDTIDGVATTDSGVDTNNQEAKLEGSRSDDVVKVVLTIGDHDFDATLTDNGWVSQVPGDYLLDDDSYDITVTGYDKAGNAVSSSEKMNLDMTPPADFVMDEVKDGDDQTPTFSGSVSDDTAKVIVYIDGKEYNGVIDDNNNWTCTATDPLDQGYHYDVEAVAFDALGNNISTKDSFAVSVDAMPEVDITTHILGTADTTPTIEGTTLNADNLTLTINGKEYSVDINDDGTWNFSLPDEDALANGAYTVVAKVSDSDDHVYTTLQDFKVDTNAVYNQSDVVDGHDLYQKDSIASDGNKVVQIALDSDGKESAVVGDKYTTALGGTIVLNSDGTFSYTAPVIENDNNDSVKDSFYYKESDGSSESDWKEYTINVNDATPVSQDDITEVGFGSEIAGSVLDNDTNIMDASAKIVKVTYNDTDYDFGDDNSVSIDADHGKFIINKDGTYQYTSTEDVQMVSNQVGDEDTDDDSDTFGSVVDITLNAFADKSTFLNDDGSLKTDADSDADVSEDSDIGDGIDSGTARSGMEDPATLVDGTEAFLVDMKENVDGLKIVFDSLDDGEQADVTLFDENGAVVKDIVVDGDSNGASMEIQRVEYKYVAVSVADSSSSDKFSIKEIAYTPKATQKDTFTYTMEDSDGDQSSSDLVVSHTNLIALHGDSATVSEAGLDDGTLAGSDANVVSGDLFDNDAGLYDSDKVASITLDGTAYTPNDDGVIVVENDTGKLEVQTTGEYTYTLKTNVADGSNTAIDFGYTLEHGDSSTLRVNVEDDVAKTTAQSEVVSIATDATAPQSYNITLVIDKSGSMNIESDDTAGTRMDATKDAISSLIDKYSTLGEVNINIVDFSDSVASSGWYMNNENGARDYLSVVNADGEASYDSVATALQAIDAPSADNNVLYVVTDNAEWTNGNTDLQNAINHVVGENGSSHIVTSTLDVQDVLLSTVESDRTIHGNLSSDNDAGTLFNFGADGGHIQTMIVDGKEYNYSDTTAHNSLNPADPYFGDKISVTTEKGGTFILDFKTGEYTYLADATQKVSGSEDITLIGIDGDGDKVKSKLVINLDAPAIKDANGDYVITNRVDDSFEISAAALMANDNNSDAPINGANDVKTIDMNLDWDKDNSVFNVDPTKDLDKENMSFEYTTTSGQDVDVEVHRVDSETLSGSDKSEVFLAKDADTTIDAGAGDDVLTGGTGNDTLNGGAGDDVVNGGAGNDTINGGAGDDTLNGGAGDDTINGGAGNDTIDGGAGHDTINGGTGDDTIVYGDGDTIDGGEGNDTLLANSDIDFTNLDSIANIENVAIESEDVTLTLDLDSVISMTDEDNTLTILSDSQNDSVTLDNGSGEWAYTGQEHDATKDVTLDVYDQDGSIVKIDHDIDVNIIS